MKAAATLIATIVTTLMLASRPTRANDTEDRIHEGLKQQVAAVVTTLDMFQAFDQSYQVAGTNDSALSREAMLIKVARRLQQQAQQLAAKAAAMETYLQLERAVAPEAAPDQTHPELEQTRDSIAALKRQIEELKAAQAAKARSVKVASVSR